MKPIKKAIVALCTLAIAAAVACGPGNNDNNGTNNTTGNNTSNNTTGNNDNNTTGTNNDNNTTGNNTTGNNSNNTTGNNSNNTTGTNNPPGGATFCQLECMTADDCAADSTDWECNANRCEFTGEAAGCTENAECQAQFSGWVTECQTDGDCPGQLCIDIGDPDAGRCATEPSAAVECATLMQEEITIASYESGDDVTVCANTSSECHPDGYCFSPCESDDDCGDLRCNTDSGTCFCDDDSQCTSAGSDTCYDGSCGCSDDASCDDLETGEQNYVCE